MLALYFFEGIAIGAVTASVIIMILWCSDIKDWKKRVQVAREEAAAANDEAYLKGYEEGHRWKLRQMVEARRELRDIRAEIDMLTEYSRLPLICRIEPTRDDEAATIDLDLVEKETRGT